MLERAAREHNTHYKKYVQSLLRSTPDKTIFIDIHGTCQRALTYFADEFHQTPYCFLLSSSYREYAEFPGICQKAHQEGKMINVVFDARGTPIEMLNFDIQGTIQNFVAKGPVRDPPEYSINRLEAYHACIQALVKHMKPWDRVIPKSLRNKKLPFELEELLTLIRRIYRVIQDNKPVLNNYIKHPGKH